MDLQSHCVKPLRDSQNTRLDSAKTTALLISAKLDHKRQATASRIYIEKVKSESLSIVEHLTARLFDEMDLKATCSSILLVGTEEGKSERPVSVGGRSHREAARPKVKEFIARALNRTPLHQMGASSLSQPAQEAGFHASYKYINLEEP